MKRLGICLLTLGWLLLLINPVMAQERLVESVATGCKAELEKYCSNVTPGEGRLLECLQKNDAKVSNRCKQARKDVGLK